MVGKTLTSMSGRTAMMLLEKYYEIDENAVELPEKGTKEYLRFTVALSALTTANKSGFNILDVVNILCREAADGKPGKIEMTYRTKKLTSSPII